MHGSSLDHARVFGHLGSKVLGILFCDMLRLLLLLLLLLAVPGKQHNLLRPLVHPSTHCVPTVRDGATGDYTT